MNNQEQLGAAGATRRAVLAGGGAACLALLLGACGSDDAPPASTPTGGGPTGGDTPTSSGPDQGSSGTVLAKEADVPSGGGVLAGTVLVVKLADGTVKAYDAHCPHMGSLVKPPENGKIVCPNHNSIFTAADGAPVSGPAETGLQDIPVKIEGGNVVAVS